MIRTQPVFSFGIEEEYFLVDQETRDLAAVVPQPLMRALRRDLGERFSPEYIRSQIETCTPVCHTAHEARRALTTSRRTISQHAAAYGLAPIAAATHPFARWSEQSHTNVPRYNAIAEDLQELGQRMLINGLHVHVGIEDREARIAVMRGLRPYLPLLLALSTSSPFWQGSATGLKSYRTAVNDATPRKGIPEAFENWAAFERAVDGLVRAGVIEDATKIWWDLRPSVRFPTLEMRITDVTPRVEDAIAIASLLRCLARCVYRSYVEGRAETGTTLLLLNENKWRAQRYGIAQGLITTGGGAVASLPEALDVILDMIREDAEHFGCIAEVESARRIARTGTSADRQLALYEELVERQGLSPADALRAVVDQLIDETASSGSGAPTRPSIGREQVDGLPRM